MAAASARSVVPLSSLSSSSSSSSEYIISLGSNSVIVMVDREGEAERGRV